MRARRTSKAFTLRRCSTSRLLRALLVASVWLPLQPHHFSQSQILVALQELNRLTALRSTLFPFKTGKIVWVVAAVDLAPQSYNVTYCLDKNSQLLTTGNSPSPQLPGSFSMVLSKAPPSSDDEYASTSPLTDRQYTPTHSRDRTPPPISKVTTDVQARRESLSSPKVHGNDTDPLVETPTVARNAASLSSVCIPETHRPVHALTLLQE